ncbi:mitoguardin 2-like [Centruroides sculpturatus]|uniref:mitoguardin 2-like n=1 Tax=Centruroides sculpturatus TaxID=218467 RepID=UPI000C6E6247|nr:mitoguardin 2-like [Centruroides sculpturatus]
MTLTAETGIPTTSLTPQQLGVMGMEALETAIGYWEDALQSYRSPDQNVLCLTDSEEGKFTQLLQKILDNAHDLQENCTQLFLYENSVLFKSDSVSSTYQEKILETDWRTMTSLSSADSFVSAQGEVADIRDFDEFLELKFDTQDLLLYQAAMKQFEENNIPYRILRTDLLKCQTDYEYIAKLHCVRLAFKMLLSKEENKLWFIEIGSQLLTDLILFAEKDPRDCLRAYDNILEFIQQEENWLIMEEELKTRGVKCLSFYDVVLDFIILDAFEDLESPPSSVVAVVQNRWLSNGFKETVSYDFYKYVNIHSVSLNTLRITFGIWMMMAFVLTSGYLGILPSYMIFPGEEKIPQTFKELLSVSSDKKYYMGVIIDSVQYMALWNNLYIFQYSNGFINHFYSISEHISPVLAWGFLGPDENLKQVCISFKDEILGFLCDIFDFTVVRYSKVEDLSSDILDVAKVRYERLGEKFSL